MDDDGGRVFSRTRYRGIGLTGLAGYFLAVALRHRKPVDAQSAIQSVAPHEWAIGHTFEFTFSLPKPANRGGHPHNWNKPAVKTSRKATPKARKPKPLVEPTPEQIEAQKEARRAYEQKRNQTPERKELKRRVTQERRDKARLLGICVVCGAPPIPDNIRCETCAEKHRVSEVDPEIRTGG